MTDRSSLIKRATNQELINRRAIDQESLMHETDRSRTYKYGVVHV